MRDRHVRVRGASSFSLPRQERAGARMELSDRRMANLVRRMQNLPGYEFFQYVDEAGKACAIDSADETRTLAKSPARTSPARTFEPGRAPCWQRESFSGAGRSRNERQAKKAIVAAVKAVAGRLGNRPATCRKYYIHPAILEAYADGSLFPTMREGERQESAYSGLGLRTEEYCVMVIIAAHQEKLAKAVRAKAA